MKRITSGKIRKKWMVLCGLCLAWAGVAGAIFLGAERETVLNFGMFTGSNWEVASADSFEIID